MTGKAVQPHARRSRSIKEWYDEREAGWDDVLSIVFYELFRLSVLQRGRLGDSCRLILTASYLLITAIPLGVNLLGRA